MGAVVSRTQFCASVQHDESSSSYQIYVLGGADLKSKDPILDVNYLSIPSFKWNSAAPLDDPHMTLTCVPNGRQIFGIGGRRAWADDGNAGCYDAPAFIYDAQSEATRSMFDPALSSFSPSSSTANDIKASPSPSSWADPAFKALFGNLDTKTSTATDNTTASPATPPKLNPSDSATRGVITGGVVGGVAGLALIIGLFWFFLARNKKQKHARFGEVETVTRQVQPMSELPVGARDGRSELGGGTYMYSELPAGNKREISELDSDRNG
ncbi:Kelch-type beta propeller [Penicillium digitatum]|uniref:Kelch-type beta propeller n=1 Tax=Penicillium digitatum TaxID=36651 RepID=A0A7T6XTN5_PENDI|nr:Kelch-type beta propeller [Penicillium digitatum]